MSDKFSQFMKEINAKGFDLRIPETTDKIKKIPTGVVSLDYVMDGGIVPGHKIELWGAEQGGKSLMSQLIIIEYQKRDKLCVLMDSEHAFDAGWFTALGGDPSKLLVCQPETLEDAGDMMIEMMIKGVDLIVVDSIINLINEAELDRDSNEPTRGGNAKINTLITKKLDAYGPKHPTVFVFVNQIRIDMNMKYGNPENTGGGRALRHWYHTRIKVNKGQKIEKGEDIVGQQVILECNKNRKGVPRRVHKFDFYFDGYVNNNASLLSLAVKYGVVQSAGAWFNYGEIKGHGEDKFGKAISEANLWEEIRKKTWLQINPRLEQLDPIVSKSEAVEPKTEEKTCVEGSVEPMKEEVKKRGRKPKQK